MFEVLAGLALEFISECSPKAKEVLDKAAEMVDEQTKPQKDRFKKESERVATMSDERLLDYARRNKERLKSSVEGMAVVKELQDRGLTHNK